ncbi:glycoside hydrolase family 63 protein [Schizothecium vesticola]|uniref:Mannosyl-oligosaccharide glucosidase n=1 Tax=Schizothecium vesticola TaxID=314040 RepID=A0AA40F737_9PEZI|nr:glycoside hydrolase family 63 protein [Schizothecium vesticola]
MAAVLRHLTVLCALCLSNRSSAQFLDVSTRQTNSSSVSSIPERSWQTWGPYRPNLYFGVRPQVPETLLMGLMWASGDSQKQMLSSFRDTCEQNDGMQGYGWTFYDTRTGGSQALHDKQLQLDLTTDFLKSEDGGSWSVGITGTPQQDAPNVRTSVILHVAVEKADSNGPKSLACESHSESESKGGPLAACRGEIAALGGRFEFQVLGNAKNNVVHDAAVKSLNVSEDKIWQAKSVFADQVKASSGDKIAVENSPGAGNMHFIQLTFQGPFKMTFVYHAADGSILDQNSVDAGINSLRSSFPARVEAVFPRTPPFQQENYAKLSQEILSNLLGGLGFFHGDTKVDYSNSSKYQEIDLDFWTQAASAMSRAPITTTAPQTLLSHTPSRPFFPRGFLWDEGFHLLPVVEWDLDLAVSVLQSWLDLMDDDGWIGREQILGPEARSRVPSQFQVQYPHYANPPTLSLLVPIIISKLAGASPYTGHPSIYMSSPDQASTMLKTIYPLLARHYHWFRRTQSDNFTSAYPRPASGIPYVGFRWRGRTPKHTLTSGLDDYPRANPPHPGELHVDALAWVGASASALQQVALYLGEAVDAEVYAKDVTAVKRNLDALHWDAARKAYCDSTIQDDKYTLVCHEGYISLFPLLLGLMDADHPNLPAVLDMISDPEKLWSPHGLRSLSKQDANYGRDENYWRGAVWINLNVLAVLRLRDVGLSLVGLSTVRARVLMIASELRKRLVGTVAESWEHTGFFWEQYADGTGEGKGSRAFTGWTAAVILLMGLQLGQGMGGEGDDSGASNGVFWAVVGVVGLMLATLVVSTALRRRAMVVVAGAVNSWITWQTTWKGGGGYREVIDLDERAV